MTARSVSQAAWDLLADSTPASAPPRHVISVSSQAGPGGQFATWTKCSCGWSSAVFSTRDEALKAADLHVEDGK